MSAATTLKRTFTEFDKEKLKKVITYLVIGEIIIFAFLFFLNRNPIDMAGNYVGSANPPIPLFAIYGSDEEPLKKPMGVTVANDRIYVTDTDNHRVQVFDYDGNFLFMFGKAGKNKGEFTFPYGIVADSTGKIYVADLSNGSISVFDKDGAFLNYFGATTDFKGPAGLTLSGKYLYVADVGDSKIKVFTLEGKKILDIGVKGTDNGQLRSPNALMVADGKIFVSDTGNDRVQVFNQLGNFAYKLDGGNSKITFLNPRGVAVDGRGTIYVVNNFTSEIFAFDKNGNKIFGFGSTGNGDEQFFLPNNIFIDSQGRIYIADSGNQRISVYQN